MIIAYGLFGLAILTLVATVISFATLEFIIFPPENKSFSQADISMPPGTTLRQTVAVADEAASMLRREPEVLDVFEDVNVGSGSLFITLRHDRKRSSQEFEREVGPKLAAIADARVTFQSQNSGFGRDVTLMLAGSDSALGRAHRSTDCRGKCALRRNLPPHGLTAICRVRSSLSNRASTWLRTSECRPLH